MQQRYANSENTVDEIIDRNMQTYIQSASKNRASRNIRSKINRLVDDPEIFVGTDRKRFASDHSVGSLNNVNIQKRSVTTGATPLLSSGKESAAVSNKDKLLIHGSSSALIHNRTIDAVDLQLNHRTQLGPPRRTTPLRSSTSAASLLRNNDDHESESIAHHRKSSISGEQDIALKNYHDRHVTVRKDKLKPVAYHFMPKSPDVRLRSVGVLQTDYHMTPREKHYISPRQVLHDRKSTMVGKTSSTESLVSRRSNHAATSSSQKRLR